MKFAAFPDERNPGDWCVEARNGDGDFLVCFFVGLLAKERAEEYAAWQNDRHAASAARFNN